MWATCGSSPRGRGTHLAGGPPASVRRFIPAWAGNTAATFFCERPSSVHPRVGGEHSKVASPPCSPGGSSPRGRGTHQSLRASHPPERFIPAWAGNTVHNASSRTSISVHPRVGGEHIHAATAANTGTGSSPRGRGTPYTTHPPGPRFRFIPAWAGNTATRTSSSSGPPVHPRVGGEHLSRLIPGAIPYGSSPRGRGTRQERYRHQPADRFIPAWAGNTIARRNTPPPPPVHPRVGGEHTAPSCNAKTVHGSSPRGRGTP